MNPLRRYAISSVSPGVVATRRCAMSTYPLSLLVHLFVGGFQLLSQLSDVQFKLCVLLVKSFQLALHLSSNIAHAQDSAIVQLQVL